MVIWMYRGGYRCTQMFTGSYKCTWMYTDVHLRISDSPFQTFFKIHVSDTINHWLSFWSWFHFHIPHPFSRLTIKREFFWSLAFLKITKYLWYFSELFGQKGSDLYEKFVAGCPPIQTPTQMFLCRFSFFGSQGIGSSLVIFWMIFQALQSELLRFKLHSLGSKLQKIPEFNLCLG